MSKIAVPSRFACLKIEGHDETNPRRLDRKPNKQNVRKNDKPEKNAQREVKKAAGKQVVSSIGLFKLIV